MPKDKGKKEDVEKDEDVADEEVELLDEVRTSGFISVNPSALEEALEAAEDIQFSDIAKDYPTVAHPRTLQTAVVEVIVVISTVARSVDDDHYIEEDVALLYTTDGVYLGTMEDEMSVTALQMELEDK